MRVISGTVAAVRYVQISSTSLCRVAVLNCDHPLATWLAPVVADAIWVSYKEYIRCGEMESGCNIGRELPVIGVLFETCSCCPCMFLTDITSSISRSSACRDIFAATHSTRVLHWQKFLRCTSQQNNPTNRVSNNAFVA